jgi:LCP family protein required for cell wall assembly
MPGSDPNEEGLRALGRAIDGKPESRRARRRAPSHAAQDDGGGRTHRKRGKHRWLKRTLIGLCVIVLLAVGAGAGYAWYLNHKVHRIPVKGLAPSETTGSDAHTENILMVGSTTRCGLAHQTARYGLCTQGVTGVNSDVVMVLHLDPSTKSVSVLSLPRDLFVPNARSTGAYKIDAALAQGPSQLVAVIEEDFGIPIQHYVELNFDTFAAVVTALGGITMEFPDRIFDHYSGLRVLTTGCHHLDGVQALQVVRARHLQYWETGDTPDYPYDWPQTPESDLARITRDHEFLRVLATELGKRGLGNPSTDFSLLGAVLPDLTVDSTLTLTDLVDLALTFHSVNVNKAPQLTLPVLVGNFGTYIYEGEDFGDIEFPTRPLDQQVVDTFLGVTADTNTMTGQPLPSPSSVQVSVVDGAGTSTAAAGAASDLEHLGFDVVGTSATTPVAQQSETLVTYSQRTPADEAAAQLVADSLSGAVVLDYGQTAGGAQVTVTTGTSFAVDATAPGATAGVTATTTTTASAATSAAPTGSSSTSTTSGTGDRNALDNGFASPSSSNPGLTAWDPRSCPAGETGNTGSW